MKLVVVEFMTLDGVMEAPGFEEHRSGRNAWAMRGDDPELGAFNARQITGADALLFGRTTFNIWAAYWPTAPEPAAAMGRHINSIPKYVVSKSLGSTDWANTTILHGDLGEDVAALKDHPGGDLMVYGSADLVGGLLERDLVDELRIVLFPVILGSGKRLFRDEADLRPYRAALPEVALDNLLVAPARDRRTAYWMRRTAEQDLAHADMADPEVLNRIIWFSVKRTVPMPEISRLPAFDAMRLGLQEEREEIAERRSRDKRD